MVSKLQFVVLLSCFMAMAAASLVAGNFYQDVDITWGEGRGKIENGGQQLSLSLDKLSGSGFQSKNEYLFGRFDLQLKLVPGNSAGTVTTFFLSSQGSNHDEIDFEFLGNASGQPYTMHTNVYAQGKGDKEQQFRLWFDPTAAFHTYSILWNSQRIIFLVDNSPIRVFNNNERAGIPFPKTQPMRMYCSLWNADDWATQGGRLKTDWSLAPFVASYRNLNINGNVFKNPPAASLNNQAWQNQGLNANERNRMRYLQSRFLIYDYCKDLKRFPQGLPADCKLSRFL